MRSVLSKLTTLTAAALICICCAAGARAGAFDRAAGILWPEDEAAGWTMTLGMEVQAYPPYGERRIELLNALIGHMSLKIAKSGETARLQVLIDGKETPARTVLQTETEEASADGAEEAQEQETLLSAGTRPADQAHTVFLMLEEGAAFLRDLPERMPENSQEKKIKQKLKTGTAVRSMSVTIMPAEDGTHPLAALIGNAAGKTVKEMLGEWEFRGRQRFTLLCDEEGRLLKANYSGRAGETAEKLRNITMEWRLLRTEDEKRDEVTLRTPTVNGADRDNWILSREWKSGKTGEEETAEPQEESLSFTFAYDRKSGNDKIQYKWEGSLTGAEGISGGITCSRTQRNSTEMLTLRPDWTECSEKQISGTLEIIHIYDKIIQEHATLQVDWQPGGETDGEIAGLTEDGMSEAFQGMLLRSILTMIPEEDLGFLKEDIPEKDWNRIMEEAEK